VAINLKNTCKINVGRLLEIDVAAGYRTLSDVDAMIALIGAEIATLPEQTKVVIAADWRPCPLFTPEVSARVMQMLSTDAARIERSGILHSPAQPTSVLQVFRLIKETGVLGERRRIFTDVDAMASFLGELLSEEERARLAKFLRK
jgi:hypothetical protein